MKMGQQMKNQMVRGPKKAHRNDPAEGKPMRRENL